MAAIPVNFPDARVVGHLALSFLGFVLEKVLEILSPQILKNAPANNPSDLKPSRAYLRQNSLRTVTLSVLSEFFNVLIFCSGLKAVFYNRPF